MIEPHTTILFIEDKLPDGRHEGSTLDFVLENDPIYLRQEQYKEEISTNVKIDKIVIWLAKVKPVDDYDAVANSQYERKFLCL
jgi:hypothetical protein